MVLEQTDPVYSMLTYFLVFFLFLIFYFLCVLVLPCVLYYIVIDYCIVGFRDCKEFHCTCACDIKTSNLKSVIVVIIYSGGKSIQLLYLSKSKDTLVESYSSKSEKSASKILLE
jgi:hypothetical protein